MKITFLGTSHGVPEKNRRCSCTMIQVGSNIYFVDMGINALEELKNYDLDSKDVKAVFITHNHCDHTGALFPFLAGLNCWWHRFSNTAIYLPAPKDELINAMGQMKMATGGTDPNFNNEFIEIEAGQIYDDGLLKVTAFRTKHCEVSYAFLFEAEGKRVFFSGDMSYNGPTDDFPMEILEKENDLLVLEGVHFEPTEFLKVFAGKEDNIKRIFFTHYTEMRLPIIEDFIKQYRDDNVTILKDGVSINL
jgi:ribonuclease BN (tRNA processing enzyme)